MRRANLLSGTLLMVALGLACARTLEVKPINTFSGLRERFANPPARYRTVPFWVWNDRVTRQKIDRQLRQFKEQGIGGVFIHPRYGLITEYLSDEWFELVKYATERARELGLTVWIYDENSYPSGFAGGHVPAEMPDSYRHGHGLVLERRDSVQWPLSDAYALALARTDSGFLVLDPAGPAPEGTQALYLLRKVSYGRSKWFAGFSYVDLLYPGVTEKFIRVTMRGYERAVGSEFGRQVPGVFTDEPNIRPPRGNAIRWTPDLFDRFEEWMGYDLRPRLASLFEEVGDWRKVRHDYQWVLLRLFTERWSKPWHDYCERHRLLWTGHYWEHGWPNPVHGPDNMAMYAYHQVPAIDMLFNQFHEGVNAQFGNVRSVREVASVANQMGRKRVLCETYGGAGWELTFADMKRLGEWEYVLGVNLMNQHLAFMSLKGDRKQDYPQSFLDHEPWWHLYHYLADHFGRLSLALSSGRERNPLLVIEPTTTAWMYAGPGTPYDSLRRRVGEPFQHFVTRLAHEQVEYDIGSEWILREWRKVDGVSLVVGEARYQAVVLPPGTENLEISTVKLLNDFLRSGGKVYCFGAFPRYVDGAPSDWVERLASNYPGGWKTVAALDSPGAGELLSWQPIRVDVAEGSWVFHQRRAFADGQLLFLANSSPDEAARGTVSLEGTAVTRLDPFTGRAASFPAERTEKGLRMSFELPPLGSLLLFVHTGAVGESADQTEAEASGLETPLPVKELTSVHRDSLNVLVLDYCDVTVDTFERTDVYFVAAQNAIWRHHGYDENPWFRGIQFRTQLVDADTFNSATGFETSYEFEVLEKPGSEELYAVVEQPDLWRVLVNGEPVEPLKGRYWLDPDFALYPIGDRIRTGRNEIRIVCKPMSIYAELEPVYVLGDFSLVPREKGWAVVPAKPLGFGPWRDQGCPFYGHSVTYRKTVEWRGDGGERVTVRLGRWAGTVAEVRVNGRGAGIVAWPPYELDVTEFVRPGENEVEVVVYGSLKNPLGPHHQIRRRGITGPGDFRRAPEHQPPGAEYDVLPYGLFEDFAVFAVAGAPPD